MMDPDNTQTPADELDDEALDEVSGGVVNSIFGSSSSATTNSIPGGTGP